MKQYLKHTTICDKVSTKSGKVASGTSVIKHLISYSTVRKVAKDGQYCEEVGFFQHCANKKIKSDLE